SSSLITSLAHLNLASFLLGMIGGAGFLLAILLIPLVHCYYRLSIFVSFFAVFAGVLLLEQFRQAYCGKTSMRWIFPVGVLGILLLGIWDQTSKLFVPSYDTTAAEFRSDRDFVHQIETLIPGQAVFQLPYAPFPEYGVQQMICYDHM